MAKLKYQEETKIISFRVPVSKILEIREKVNEILTGIKDEVHRDGGVTLERPEFPEDIKDLSVQNAIKAQAVMKQLFDRLKCDCFLDANGFLRRGKIKCTKTKNEHKF